MSRFLALDVGDRRIGVAIADTISGSITRLTTIRRAHADRDAATLMTLAREHDAHQLVLGLPLNADGSEGAQARDTRIWGEAIERLTRLPVVWRDERHTSERAELVAGRMARRSDGGPPTARTRGAHRARVDQLAAEAIAQAELDARRAP